MTQIRHEVYRDGALVESRMVDVDPREEARGSLLGKAKAAVAVNSVYLALASPTAAQTAAQVQRLTREVNALIKLLLRDSDTSGT